MSKICAFFPASQSFLKAFSIALIGWIKASPSSGHIFFGRANRLSSIYVLEQFTCLPLFSCV